MTESMLKVWNSTVEIATKAWNSIKSAFGDEDMYQSILKYKKYQKRVSNRQLLYEKRLTLGRKM